MRILFSCSQLTTLSTPLIESASSSPVIIKLIVPLKSGLSLMNLNELREVKPADLQKMALDLKVEDTGRMTRQEQIYAILKSQSEKQVEIYAEGVLEILQEGYGFLRSPKYSYLPGPDDIYVSKSQVRSFLLKSGDTIGGYVRPVSYTHLTLPTNREV